VKKYSAVARVKKYSAVAREKTSAVARAKNPAL
jgi:hypothetical protein